MFPLDEVYGPKSYRAFKATDALQPTRLKVYREASLEIWAAPHLTAKNYTELVDIVSFFSVMNKRHTVYFRGQGSHQQLIPTLFRSRWSSISGANHNIPNDPAALQEIYKFLNKRISEIVLSVCSKFPMPRRSTLSMFREAVWTVAQHYGLWPTPLIDITPNLRAAASFALWDGRSEGNLYVVAMPPSTNSITYEADQHIVLARLQAVCPPIAKRPHYQDGFLVGRFPFDGPNPNQIDKDPRNVSDLSRRLVARIFLQNSTAPGNGFWSEDFPRMSTGALTPKPEHDELLKAFMRYAEEIDGKMQGICRS